MKSGKSGAKAISGLLVLLLAAVTALARAQVPEQAGKAPETQQKQTITIKAKIGFMKNLGGYYIEGVEPPGTIMIDNQNRPLLKKLKKSGKTVTIEGYQTLGADHLFVEKIDGKKYSGK